MCSNMAARMAFPFDLLVRSICPSIVGNEMAKAGIVLALLGGQAKGCTTVLATPGGLVLAPSAAPPETFSLLARGPAR